MSCIVILISDSGGNAVSGVSYTLLGHSLSIISLSRAKKGVYLTAGTGGGGGGDDGGAGSVDVEDVDGVDVSVDVDGVDIDGIDGAVDGCCGRGQLCLHLHIFIASIASSSVIFLPFPARKAGPLGGDSNTNVD